MNTTDATRATAEAMSADKPDLLDITDIIHEARLLVGCIRMASVSLAGDHMDSIAIVATEAINRLVDAGDALEDICQEQTKGDAS